MAFTRSAEYEAGIINSRPRTVAPSRHVVALALLLAGTMLPILWFRIPVLADYPDHLARMYAIAALAHDQLLSRYYELRWQLVPNLALDALVPPLAKAVGVFMAGKIFVLATALLLPTGVLALHRALYRRPSLWPLTSFLFVYNAIFLWGFLNYLFAVGLALWGAAIWIRQRDAHPLRRGVVSWLFILAIFFSHLLGVGIYGLAIGCFELERWWRRKPGMRESLGDLLILAVPALLVLPLVLAGPTVGFAQETHWEIWPDKALGLYYVFKSYNRELAILFALATIGVAAWGTATKRLRLHPAGLLFAGAAAAFYMAMPSQLMSAANVDVRLPSTFILFLIAMSNWETRDAVEARRLTAGLLALAALLLVEIGTYWTHYTRIIDRIEQSFAAIPAGSRVLVAVNEAGTDRTTYTMSLHFPALVMIERSAFYSDAFAHPAQQPLQVKSAFRNTTPVDGEALPVEDLTRSDEHEATDAKGRPLPPYLPQWRQHFDFLYVLYTPPGYRPSPDGLQQLARTRDFALYRIMDKTPG